MQAAIRGYRKKEEQAWKRERWHAWVILSALGSKIECPEELFPIGDEVAEIERRRREAFDEGSRLLDEWKDEFGRQCMDEK